MRAPCRSAGGRDCRDANREERLREAGVALTAEGNCAPNGPHVPIIAIVFSLPVHPPDGGGVEVSLTATRWNLV